MTRLAVAGRAAAAAALAAFLLDPALFAPALRPLTENGAPPIYDRGSLLVLSLDHLALVLGAGVVSTAVAVAMGIFVTRPAGAAFLPLSRSVVNVGQVFPPVAVLAIAVPAVGFGTEPTLIALILYGLLPIFENTLAGLGGVDGAALEAARGMGLDARQTFFRVELPLALPVILAGVRLSLVIGIGTATIGSTVAAKGLGEVIIAGLQSSNTAFIFQGGVVVGLLAVLTYDAVGIVEARLARHLGRAAR